MTLVIGVVLEQDGRLTFASPQKSFVVPQYPALERINLPI
jgi:hypothetical protein